MKQFFLSSFMMVFLTVSMSAQKFAGLDKSPLDVALYKVGRNDKPIMKIYYSRPSINNRTLDKLAPAGQVWRLGANEATELVVNQDLMLAGSKIVKGSYTLFAIPGEKTWTIIVNSDTDGWGAYAYDIAKDVVRFEAEVSNLPESLEALSIDANAAKNAIFIGWGTTLVTIPVKL